MRVSTTMQYRNHLNYLQGHNSRLDLASQVYNTGKKFQTAGQDPGGMSAHMKYEADIASYKQYTQNSKIVADTFAQEETALGQIYDALSSVQTRLIQAINGTLDDGSRAALAEDIKQVRDQMFNLMNTKNAEGEFIFSGAQSSKPTYIIDPTGKYICQADGSNKYVNVSPTLSIQANDSGLNIFENTNLANTFDFVNGQNQQGFIGSVKDYDEFNTFFKENFNHGVSGADAAPAGVNQFKIEVIAKNKFKMTNVQTGQQIGPEGEIKDGKMIIAGMQFELPNGAMPNAGDSVTVSLRKPEQDNILNQLTDIAEALQLPSDEYGPNAIVNSSYDLTRQVARMQENVNIAKKQVDTFRGMVGARGANIDAIIKSNESIHDIKKESDANVVEADAFTAVSDLMQAQAALQVAQQSYQVVHSATLFDFMR